MATAFNRSNVGTTEEDLFNASADGGGVTTVSVGNRATSGADLLVNIPGLHAATEWFPIPPNHGARFRAGQAGITRVRAKAAAGTVAAYGGVIARVAVVATAD